MAGLRVGEAGDFVNDLGRWILFGVGYLGWITGLDNETLAP